jgi:hypothetical protein
MAAGLSSVWIPDDLSQAAHLAQESVYAAVVLINRTSAPDSFKAQEALIGGFCHLTTVCRKARDLIKPLTIELAAAHRQSGRQLPVINGVSDITALGLAVAVAYQTADTYGEPFESDESWGFTVRVGRLQPPGWEPGAYDAICRRLKALTKPDGKFFRKLIDEEVRIAATMRVEAAIGDKLTGNSLELNSSAAGSSDDKPKRATVNMRMMDEIQKNREAMGWGATKWSRHLRCSKAAVCEAQTYKNLESARLAAKAEHMKDRRRKPKASDGRRN